MLINRMIQQLKRRNKSDFLRKVIFYFKENVFTLTLIRKLRAWFYFKNGKVIIGKGVRLKGLPYNIQVGDDTNFYDGSICIVGNEDAVLEIGNSCVFSFAVLIACTNKIEIGSEVLVGEYTSIRDTTHSYKPLGKSIKSNGDISSPIKIGNDVWIGRGCIIMPGSVIGDGVIIGANSIVKGTLESYSVYAGAPLKFIISRKG